MKPFLIEGATTDFVSAGEGAAAVIDLTSIYSNLSTRTVSVTTDRLPVRPPAVSQFVTKSLLTSHESED